MARKREKLLPPTGAQIDKSCNRGARGYMLRWKRMRQLNIKKSYIPMFTGRCSSWLMPSCSQSEALTGGAQPITAYSALPRRHQRPSWSEFGA